MSKQTSVEGSGPKALRRLFGPLCLALGTLLILASFGGTWGPAYGQTVVTPTPRIPVADPRIIKTVDPGCGEPGDHVIFTLTLTNEGSADATNVVVTDTLPAELILEEVTTSKGTVTISGNSFTVVVGTLSPGEVVTIVVQASLRADAPVDIIIINIGHLRSDQGDRESSVELPVKEACATPPILPPTGHSNPEPGSGSWPWLLPAGILFLLLGIILSLRARLRPAEE